MKRARLAIVDDSPFIRKALSRVFSTEPSVVVVGCAASGEELLQNLDRWNPDVITMDLSMPGLSGLETIDRVMQIRPIPILVLSTHSGKDMPMTIEALHRGAIDFIDKEQYSRLDFGALRSALMEKIGSVTSEEFVRVPVPATSETPEKIEV